MGSSTKMRYVWMNTLIVVKKPWERMVFGKTPLVNAKEWPKFSAVMSCSPVRAVEDRDGLRYPVWQPTTKEGKARLRVNERSISMRQMERLLQVGGQSEGWTELVSCGYGREGDWRRWPVHSLDLWEEALLGRYGDSVVFKSDTFPYASGQLLPEEMATREMVLGKGSYRDAELFWNLGVWRDF